MENHTQNDEKVLFPSIKESIDRIIDNAEEKYTRMLREREKGISGYGIFIDGISYVCRYDTSFIGSMEGMVVGLPKMYIGGVVMCIEQIVLDIEEIYSRLKHSNR